jgi:putative ABC transport system permease protein
VDLSESLRLALRGLAANKLRAALTMLGIIIGVSAVITLLSVGQGVEAYVTGQFQGIGSNLLFVFPGGPDEQTGPPGETQNRGKPLTNQDAEALADPYQVPLARAVAMEYFGYGVVEAGRESTTVQVSGVSNNYQAVRQYFVQEGQFFTEADSRSAARVAVVGQTVLTTLFPAGEYAIGQSIKINSLPFKIVGVLEKKGGGLFGDQDAVVLVPLTTAQQRLFNARTPDGRYQVNVVYLQAQSDPGMEALTQEISQVLRDRHGIAFRGEDDFTVVTQSDLISAFGEVTGVLTIFLGAIAGISLLVGGIGIMNIMLVSVTERTREIGLRKAVGAKRRDILVQFLIEAMTMALVGGALGIVLGAAGSLAVAAFQPDLPVAVTLGSVALATGFSAAIGLFFGIYPAFRASQLSPIDALRYE